MADRKLDEVDESGVDRRFVCWHPCAFFVVTPTDVPISWVEELV